MTGFELLNNNISYYYRINYNISRKDIKIIDWISKYSLKNKNTILKIRELYSNPETKKIGKEMKSLNLPAVTISGVFHGYRRISDVTKLNPIIAIDIDKDDNPHIKDWNELKYKVAELPYVFLTSYSCSGQGLYCFIYYNMDLDFNKMFNALESDFKDMNIIIDNNCKDITRLRFISYDDNILIRQGEVEQYNKEKEIEINLQNKEYNDDINESDEFIYKAIYYLIIEDKYRANKYNIWLKNGFILSTFGNKGLILFLLLSQLSDNYDRDKAIQQFNICQSKTRYTKSSLSYYFSILKDIHGIKWKDIIKEYKVEN